ncbi:MAG: c-type cytochrome [Litorivicinus sp.]
MKTLLITAALAIAPMSALAAGDAAAGQGKSLVCASCHGQDGKSMIPTYPNLAGQNAAYLEMALKGYRSQERTGLQAALMYGMAANLSDQDIADLAAYYSSK